MKKQLLFLTLMISLSVLAQIPSYYNDVDITLSGTSLKNELSTKIIATHTTTLSYGWDVVREADTNPNNSSEVILLYGWNDSDGDVTSDRIRGAFENGGSVGNWNREHVYPKSLGNPNLGTSGPGADVHHLRASDVQKNSTRNSNLFADGDGAASYITSSGGFYPGDEWKGDVARMMMYMYLRYDSQCLPSNVTIGSTVSSDSNMVELLLEWNAEDPVSAFEKQRNEVVASYQGNRNPFIDNPAFATAIWGGVQAEDLFGDTTSNNGDSDNSGTDNSESVSDLIISEYVEGSSYNKAIEIANFTGASVNLSSYSILRTTNGNGTWANEYALSGTLAQGDVLVIAHSSATLISADYTTSSTMNFNGNDAVALFKNDVLIDVIGTSDSSANFGQNTTLRRKSSISLPNTSYNSAEWGSYNSNTVDGLGAHIIDNDSSENNGSDNNDTSNLVYCDSKGSNTNYEYIDYVAIGVISNSTAANGGYADFTSQTGNLPYGSNTIIVSAGFASSAYTEYWKVWIDFNQDGVFDNDEEVVSGSSSSSGNLSYTFPVPTSAISGSTRMRVAMKWNAEPTACETFSYGEVEDYKVLIGNSSKGNSIVNDIIIDEELGDEAAVFSTSVYPNPTTDFINITLGDNRKVSYTLLDTSGKILLADKIERNIDISNFEAGVYLLIINDGQKSISQRIIKK